MAKQLPAGFDRARALAGLRRAMEFGEPTRAEDKATFYRVVVDTDAVPRDDDAVPFDPAARRDVKPTPIQVPCAAEVFDVAGKRQTFGDVQPTRAEITLLDDDYQKVVGFSYVVLGGDKYIYSWTEPPAALGSLDVWTIHVDAEDER